MRKIIQVVEMLMALVLIRPTLILAQPIETTATTELPVVTNSAPMKSGYREGTSLEGGDSVTADLSQDDLEVGSVLSFPRIEGFFAPWFTFKRKLNDNYGLKLQFSYQALYQTASESSDEDNAAGGRGQFQGTWNLIGRNTKNPGLLSFRIENRHTLGTEIPPTQLGNYFGSATPTGGGFSDFGSALTEVAWRQTLFDGGLKLVVGKISATSWCLSINHVFCQRFIDSGRHHVYTV